MRKLNFLFRTVLLLCALVGVVSPAWADTATLEITSTVTSQGNLTDNKSNTWAFTTDGSLTGNNSYIQAGTNNKSVSYIRLSTSAFSSKQITKVQVWGTSKANTNVTAKVIIGTTTIGTSSVYTSQNASSGGTEFSVNNTNNVSGNLTVEISRPSSANGAIYFNKVIVTYASSHTLTYSATNGNITGVGANNTAVESGASIAEGATVTLTATPASGYAFTGWSVEGTGSSLSSTSTNPTTFTMGTANATVTANFEVSSTVANPTFSVIAGTYSENQSVELNCPTDGATIYYTTDGTDPTTSSTEYAGAISVTKTTTIKAIAVKSGLTNSSIASATYTLKCATPTITVPEGYFFDSKTVTMESTSAGVSIYYTTDGTTVPTSASTLYDSSNKPSITATTTIKAIAIKDGWSDSEVATETFTKINVKTVSEALTAIAALDNYGTISEQYVRGTVSTTGNISSGAVTYFLSDDGLTTNQLQVYKGKSINGANFTTATNLVLGDEVVVYGTLQNYGGNPQFTQGSQVISKVAKTTPTFYLDITSKTLDAYTKESVDVVLTTNTDGIIGCESDDEDVATVVKKSDGVYTITAKTEGNATITIYSTATATYKQTSATVEITVEDERTDAGISFAEDAIEKTWGDSFTGQALTNTNSVAVEWSSTDEAVATVTSTGVVTILKAGETDIKATFAGNATYKAAVASYTLTVNKANAGLSYTTTSFDIMLNDNSFEAPTLNNPNNLTGITYTSNNEEVALVGENDGVLAYDETKVGTAMITASFAGNDWYKAGSANYTINIIDPTVKGSKYNPYTVAEVNTGDYSGSNYVKGYIVGFFSGKDSEAATSGNSNFALADTPDDKSGATTIAVQLPSGAIRNAWNIDDNDVIGMEVLVYGNITGYFTNKTGVKSTSSISAVSVPASLNASGYATFASTNALDFSDDSEFSAWQITDVTSSEITFTQITGKVAAGTGILLKGTASSTINIPVAASGSDISATNKLTGITTATAISAGSYYGLSGDKFVPVAAGNVPAGKALLPASAIPTTARELKFVFEGETTGIAEMKNKIADGKYYNLNGQRVENLKKGGLYIMNGKKVVIK